MSCGCNSNYNTVQYAPPACNPNFPTSCTALGAGTIQRVVGEDSSYCKYTVPTLSSNSILFYNGSTGILQWANGSSANPIFIGNGSGQAVGNTSCQLQATTPTGQLVAFNPSTSTETQFPIVSPSGTSTNWGTIENIIPNQGIVFKTGVSNDGGYFANTVYQLTGSAGQYVSFNSAGNPIATTATVDLGYAQKFNTYTAIIGDRIAADTTNNPWTLTLPANASLGSIVTIADANGTWATNNLTVVASGSLTIQGSSQSFIGNVSNWQVIFYYNGSTWSIIVA